MDHKLVAVPWPSWVSPACGSGPAGWASCPRSCTCLEAGCQVFLVLSFRMGLLPALTGLSSAPQPGDMKSDPKNNCTFFSCVKIHNQLISSVSNITCPDFDPTTCLPVSGLARAWLCVLCPDSGSPRTWGLVPSAGAVASALDPFCKNCPFPPLEVWGLRLILSPSPLGLHHPHAQRLLQEM